MTTPSTTRMSSKGQVVIPDISAGKMRTPDLDLSDMVLL